jgi:hypothetical protein
VEKSGVLTDMHVFKPSGVVESNAVLLFSPLPRSKPIPKVNSRSPNSKDLSHRTTPKMEDSFININIAQFMLEKAKERLGLKREEGTPKIFS